MKLTYHRKRITYCFKLTFFFTLRPVIGAVLKELRAKTYCGPFWFIVIEYNSWQRVDF